MIVLDTRRKIALRALAVAASIPLMIQAAHPRPACAAQPGAAAAPAPLARA